MKKIAFCILAIYLLFTFYPNKTNAAIVNTFSFISSDPEKATNTEAKANAEAKVKTQLFRLNEIKKMDKSKLNSSDKKKLRVESRFIKQKIRELYRGQYHSMGSRIMVELILMM